MKHRTQILLDDWQYQALLEQAGRLKVSLASLIRRAVDRLLRSALPKKRSQRALSRFAGVITDAKAPISNVMIDQVIYRKDWK